MRPKVIDQKTIRTENRKKILRLLIRKREVTIPEISREIEISIPTVTKNISQLIEEGIAEEAGVSESTVGRKPMVIKFLPDAYYAIGVEFAIEYVRIVLTNLDSVIKADRTLRNIDYSDIDRLMTIIRNEINSIVLEKEIPIQKVLGIGFSLPGPTNEEMKFLKVAPNLGIKHVDFTKYESMFEFPLFVENDANAAAVAELTLGIAKTMRSLVYICVMSMGIGCGIVVGGHLYRGRSKLAGEISHMRVASHGRQCSCGWQDCWELYASTEALVKMYQEKTGKTLSTVQEFFATLKKYEPVAAEVFDEYLEYLALGIQHIILVQDPHYVIVGGDLSLFEAFFLEPLKEKILVENSFYDNSTVEIMCSTLKENAFVLGASLLPFEKIFSLHDI
jgi:predicted NBD/HSP70 family sugar kinase